MFGLPLQSLDLRVTFLIKIGPYSSKHYHWHSVTIFIDLCYDISCSLIYAISSILYIFIVKHPWRHMHVPNTQQRSLTSNRLVLVVHGVMMYMPIKKSGMSSQSLHLVGHNRVLIVCSNTTLWTSPWCLSYSGVLSYVKSTGAVVYCKSSDIWGWLAKVI